MPLRTPFASGKTDHIVFNSILDRKRDGLQVRKKNEREKKTPAGAVPSVQVPPADPTSQQIAE